MGSLRQLAGQTALYGVPAIVGRLLNYLLVPLQTYIFAPDQYGIVGELYAWTSLLYVILTYGMETAFFKFSVDKENREKTISTITISLFVTSFIFAFGCCMLSGDIAATLRFADHPEYIRMMAVIVSIDAFVSVLFAQLRLLNKSIKFALFKFVNIFVNILLNLFFLGLCPYLESKQLAPGFLELVYNKEIGIGYIFIANLMASITSLLLLLPDILKIKLKFDFNYWKKLFKYAFPLMILGLAGIVNETMDRVLIKNLTPPDQAQAMVGIYSACFKISVMLTIFVQAFKYAAEPFFFGKSKDKDAKKTYSDVMTVFVFICSALMLAILLYLDVVKYFVGPKYHVGLNIVPILLVANLFSGIFYNLSIWYKLTGQTKFGAYIASGGAVITLISNFILIPRIGYLGAAWTHLICYTVMMVASYFLGQKYYHVDYELKKIFFYIFLAIAIYLVSCLIPIQSFALKMVVHSLLLIGYIVFVLFTNKKIITLFKR